MRQKNNTADGNTAESNKKRYGLKTAVIILLGSGFLLLAMAFSTTKGAANIPLQTVWEALLHFDGESTHHLIVVDIRLPRVIASSLVGMAFAVSGAIMQGTTRNPMADSGLMGLNSGAGFALSICFAFFPGTGYLQTILFSFAGTTLGAE